MDTWATSQNSFFLADALDNDIIRVMLRSKAPDDIKERRKNWKKRKTVKTNGQQVSWWKRPVAFLTFALSCIAGFVGLYTAAPRIGVQVSGTVRSRDPMGTVFTISNDGMFAVSNVVVHCGIDQVRNQYGGGVENLEVTPLEGAGAKVLLPSQKLTTPCAHAVSVGSTSVAKVSIGVDYSAWYWPWSNHVEFPMQAERADDGTWVWKNIAN